MNKEMKAIANYVFFFYVFFFIYHAFSQHFQLRIIPQKPQTKLVSYFDHGMRILPMI